MKQIIKERQQEMEQSLKNTEQNLEATKKNFDQTSQQFNTILTVLLACNPSLADFLDKAKQPQQESQ